MNFEFMTIDTSLPPCMPFPRALTGFPVSSTAKVMYCRMLDAIPQMGRYSDRYHPECQRPFEQPRGGEHL